MKEAYEQNDAVGNENVIPKLTAQQIAELAREGRRGSGYEAICDNLGIDHQELTQAAGDRTDQTLPRALDLVAEITGLPIKDLLPALKSVVAVAQLEGFLAGARYAQKNDQGR